MSVIEVQQSVIMLLIVLILMAAMSVHAGLDSQKMDFSALVCIIIHLHKKCKDGITYRVFLCSVSHTLPYKKDLVFLVLGTAIPTSLYILNNCLLEPLPYTFCEYIIHSSHTRHCM